MRHGGELRGNSYDRRRRKVWLLKTFGTGRSCLCHWCRKRLRFETLTVDRLVPGEAGGRYVRRNIVPACLKCNRECHARQPTVKRRWRRDYTTKEFLAVTAG